MLNVDVRDNLNVLSTHTHTGAAGQGGASMSGLTLAALATLTFADQSANPDAAGEIQRNGNDILWYGSSVVNLTAADASAGTASLRSLGTTSVKAAAGNHTHTMSQEAEAEGIHGGTLVLSGITGGINVGTSETDIISVSHTADDSNNILVVSAVAICGGTVASGATYTARLDVDTTTLETETSIGPGKYVILQVLRAPGDTSSHAYKLTIEPTSSNAENTTCTGTLGITEVTI
jgi:hypothetical protein